MGRIRFVLYKVSKLLPRTYRKPFILISSILGLFAFFNVLTGLTKSVYLLSVKDIFDVVIPTLQANGSLGIGVIFICVLISWLSFKYYKSVQTFITMCYIIILILAFLPFVLGGS